MVWVNKKFNFKRSALIKFFAIHIILLTLMIGCNERKKEIPITAPKVIREIDKIRLVDMNGKAISVTQYQGKTIFINFWATWCKPCIKEMPSIKEAQNILQKEKIIFLMASDESIEQITEFELINNYNFNYVRIENSEEMKIQSLPANFIFNAKGNLAFSASGARKWSEKNNLDLILKIAKENE